MDFTGIKVGIAVTGSFCTFGKVKEAIRHLVNLGAEVLPIFSDNAQRMDTRFANAQEFMREIEELTGHTIVKTIPEVEPLGPGNAIDVLLIAPCTGNTLAKLANGITDTPALMAAKGHLRNGKPLVISVSTNDGLGVNFQNIGKLFNSKNIYFVPFGQDNPEEKPYSLAADVNQIPQTLEKALKGKQRQPVLR